MKLVKEFLNEDTTSEKLYIVEVSSDEYIDTPDYKLFAAVKARDKKEAAKLIGKYEYDGMFYSYNEVSIEEYDEILKKTKAEYDILSNIINS
jgi:hypothetical protein